MSALTPTELAAARSRARLSLVAGVALGSTGHIAAVTVASIVARDMLGNPTLAGAPAATVVFGAALGSVMLSAFMARRGRRAGIVAGYALGVLGALLATASILIGSLVLFLAGMLVIGFGNSSNQLSRYTAADLVPAARRASAIGIVVWGATVGSVAGPSIVPISSELAVGAGLPPLTGPFLVPVLFVGLAAILSFVLLRPDPYEIADASASPLLTRDRGAPIAIREVLRRRAVAAAIIALVVGQFVMVLIMTMTPLHMDDHGHDLTSIGVVLSAHSLGMFALSPLSGRLSERIGHVPTVFLGLGVIAAASLLAAVAPAEGGEVLLVALFLLGLGWSFGFVAGSALLSEHLEIHERTRVQGVADALIWSASAAASLGSGVVVAAAGYTARGILGIGAIVLPVLVLQANREQLRVRVAGS